MDIKAIIFTDLDNHLTFAPLTLTKPTAKLRMGILTFEERWLKMLEKIDVKAPVYYQTENYLQDKFKAYDGNEVCLWINPLVIPSMTLLDQIVNLEKGQVILDDDGLFIAGWTADIDAAETKEANSECLKIQERWELFQKNAEVLDYDYQLVTEGRKSATIDPSNQVIGNHVFVEEGAKVSSSILNSDTGPIYIGKNAEVMEGCMIRGGFALGKNAVLKMGTKIYGATTVGNYSKIGGEVNNSVITGYSNKAHDGFMGNSVIGEWCNLGADSNTSNLKNNYSNLRIYNYKTGQLEQTDVQFCGVIMGDHSKTGINTMLNTGTVVGVNANIFDAGFPPKYIPSFSWGGLNDKQVYNLEKAKEVAEVVCSRRSVQFTDIDAAILKHLHPEH